MKYSEDIPLNDWKYLRQNVSFSLMKWLVPIAFIILKLNQ